MRTIALVALLLVGCGGQPDCEKITVVTQFDGGAIPPREWYFEITCIHECGAVLRTSYWIPGPSCEWERRVCSEYCAGVDAGISASP